MNSSELEKSKVRWEPSVYGKQERQVAIFLLEGPSGPMGREGRLRRDNSEWSHLIIPGKNSFKEEAVFLDFSSGD